MCCACCQVDIDQLALDTFDDVEEFGNLADDNDEYQRFLQVRPASCADDFVLLSHVDHLFICNLLVPK